MKDRRDTYRVELVREGWNRTRIMYTFYPYLIGETVVVGGLEFVVSHVEEGV